MSRKFVNIPVLVVEQPIGQFFVGVMSANLLNQIAFADMRQIERDIDAYIGIQRNLREDRVREISEFVDSIDATFPTSIVLAIPGSCAEFDANTNILEIKEGTDEETGERISWDRIASILDGQHRLAGLENYSGDTFTLPVSIFVDADMADQAFVFATVNLAQTKVNKSLVYDLLDYQEARSPQKSCHNIAVALDRHEKSPFYEMIKRLGFATPGRTGETLAQATFVLAIQPLISKNPNKDRDRLARGKSVNFDEKEYQITPLRGLWVDKKDTDITRILFNYFSAVSKKWPNAWNSRERGDILPRTNGYRGFMRLLKPLLLHLRPDAKSLADSIPSEPEFAELLDLSTLVDGEFNTDTFPPGTSGEKRLFDRLREEIFGG